MHGSIQIDLFSTLDGVMQAPGSPTEDPENGFRYGGWQAPFADAEVGERVMAGIRSMDALLLGRKTYDIWAAYWPVYGEGPAAEIARTFDRLPKYVVSRGRPTLGWAGAQLVSDHPVDAAERLRARHRDVHVVGSVELARTLVAAGAFDVLNLWVYPVALGAGKRLFPEVGRASGLRLREPATSTAAGTVILKYGPGDPVRTGDMAAVDA